MRYIAKGSEPRALAEYRLRGGQWDGDDSFASVKDRMREALVREQGWLCCYCMRRITPSADGMNIEHWSPRHLGAQQLDWHNLLGVCKGDPRAPAAAQHCDLRKGGEQITMNPQDAGHIATLSYSDEGQIKSSNAVLQEDLETRLNLNTLNLRNRRKSAVRAVQEGLERKHPHRSIPLATLKNWLDRYSSPAEQVPEYWGAIEYWLGRRFRRSKASI